MNEDDKDRKLKIEKVTQSRCYPLNTLDYETTLIPLSRTSPIFISSTACGLNNLNGLEKVYKQRSETKTFILKESKIEKTGHYTVYVTA